MLLVIVDLNGKRLDDRSWALNEAHIALEALAMCGMEAHLEVRSTADESFVFN